MKRIVSRLASAALIAGAIVTAATAALAVTDVSNHSITCNTVSGTATFKPPLNATGTVGMEIAIKGKLTACIDNTDAGVRIDSGTFSGTLHDPTSFCDDLITTFQAPVVETGSLIYRWKANRTTPIRPTLSTQVVNSRTSDLYDPAAGVEPSTSGGTFGSNVASKYVALSFGTASVKGAFTGGDSGVGSSNIIVSRETFHLIHTLCDVGVPPGTGFKTLNFAIGTVTLQ
jgi:hypothetical protein